MALQDWNTKNKVRLFPATGTVTSPVTDVTLPIIISQTSGVDNYNLTAIFEEMESMDPYWDNTVLAMPFYAPNGLVDLKGNTTTVVGSLDSSGDMVYFNGTSYLTVPDSTDLNFYAENFTVECTVLFSAFTSNRCIIDKWGSTVSTSWQLYYSNTTSRLRWFVGSTAVLEANVGISVGFLYHIAISRSAGTIRLFINGLVVASASDATVYYSTLPLALGIQYSTFTNYLNGYLKNIRITKGIARYTANFVPPHVANDLYWDQTVLAMPMNGANNSTTFLDLKGRTVTAAGNAKISTAQSRFGGSSAYFDGNGDYLLLPYSSSFAFNGVDWSFDAWVHLTSLPPAWGAIFSAFQDSGALGWRVMISSAGVLHVGVTGDGPTSPAGTININTWYHIAASYSNGDIRIYVDGLLVDTQTATINNTSLTNVWIGSTNGVAWFLAGYIADLRITKGIARYIGDFTPPTRSVCAQESNELTFTKKLTLEVGHTGVQLPLTIKSVDWSRTGYTATIYTTIPSLTQEDIFYLYWDKTHEDSVYTTEIFSSPSIPGDENKADLWDMAIIDSLFSYTEATYSFTGYVTVEDVPAIRPVALYNRQTLELETWQLSDETGYFNLKTTTSGTYFVNILPELTDNYNILSYDKIELSD